MKRPERYICSLTGFKELKAQESREVQLRRLNDASKTPNHVFVSLVVGTWVRLSEPTVFVSPQNFRSRASIHARL